mmetsp:Transcript_89247/g.178371  ORF Transcript_89247/g.178371 Transcript_89247/m.178371 type:complete len:177 (+) Transcript_89247:392-922(+)
MYMSVPLPRQNPLDDGDDSLYDGGDGEGAAAHMAAQLAAPEGHVIPPLTTLSVVVSTHSGWVPGPQDKAEVGMHCIQHRTSPDPQPPSSSIGAIPSSPMRVRKKEGGAVPPVLAVVAVALAVLFELVPESPHPKVGRSSAAPVVTRRICAARKSEKGTSEGEGVEDDDDEEEGAGG